MSSSTLQARLDADLGEHLTVEREIAHGGMAVVFLVRDRKHDRLVAVKVLDPMLGFSALADRFHREIALLARLQHPHILPLLDSGAAAGSLYYVMPYVSGLSLRQRLDREGPLDVRDALRIAVQVAGALAHAHAEGIVHRDVKPENILLPGYHGADVRSAAAWYAVVCDFGIAHLTGRDTLGTATDDPDARGGAAIGTPAYMAPEQAIGVRDVDARADVYALGVVLVEMLTGDAAVAREFGPRRTGRFRFSTTSHRTLRRDVPRWLARRIDRVLVRALAGDPAARFESAAAAREALTECLEQLGTTEHHARRPWRRVAVGAAAGAAVLALALGVPRASRQRVSALFARAGPDPSLIVVLPFLDHATSRGDVAALDGADCGQLLYDALAQWRDVRLVDALRVNDALLRAGRPVPVSLEESLQIARRVGGGQLVWGEVGRRDGDSLTVRATSYDVERGVARRSEAIGVAPRASDVARRFAELVELLLVGRTSQRLGDDAAGTRVLAAWHAYARGRNQLARWQLDSAVDAFRQAVTLDDGYAAAHLWLAQALSWRMTGDDAVTVDAIRVAARSALRAGAGLPAREARHAAALLAVAEGRFPDACDSFEAARRADSTDFRAWYGLGECRSRDPVVVRDARRRTGWRFRASRHAAVESYVRALDLAPSFLLSFREAVHDRLATMLLARGRAVILGRDSSGARRFAAMPAMRADTLLFDPVPIDQLQQNPDVLPDSTTDAAVARNKDRLTALTRGWVAAMPREPNALEALALALESQGRLTGADGALAAVRRARALPTTRLQGLRLAATEARELLETGRFADARALADSALAAAGDDPDAETAETVVGLAALAGRTTRYIALMRAQRDRLGAVLALEGPVPPAALLDAAADVYGYALHGAPTDSIATSVARAERLASDWSRRDRLRRVAVEGMFFQALQLAVPAIGSRAFWHVPDPGFHLRRAQYAALTRDRAMLAREDSILTAETPIVLATPVFVEVVLGRALLLVDLGRRADAAALLDAALDALPGLGVDAFGRYSATSAATIVRVMALRAELAARTGQRDVARRWASAVVTLWANADPALAPTLARMRAILAAG